MSRHPGRTLVVYHTADIHNRCGFGTKLAALVEPDALLVDCGDALRGSSTIYHRDEPIVADFQAAPYRVAAVGNREFHYRYAWFLARARSLPMPLVCSNVLDLFGRMPSPFQREFYAAVRGMSIRMLGLLVPQYRTGGPWERVLGWRFLAPAAALSDLLGARGGADATIVLSHLGLRADRALAAAFPGLAAIVGGHSHDTLTQPEFVGRVPIVHCGPYARYVGRLELSVDVAGSRVVSYRLVPLRAARPAA
ncbi:MAG: metallophosphoesterase [Candidatus Eremiobacteraeota bacterium]|nr:metallophosphoesterase [Candidatus Eremiobacteraeota bacterium]MBC5828246.1 metallophosphoesterase [Candidatus Eremiobacteraeota bacterium]